MTIDSSADSSAAAWLTHDEAEELLPFYANGSLTGAELRRMQTHVQSCLLCRRELAEEQELARVFRAVDNATVAASDSLHRLLDRLDDTPASGAAPRLGRPTLPGARSRLTPAFNAGVAALAATVVLAIGGGIALWSYQAGIPQGLEYATLSKRETARAARPGDLRVILHPDVSAHAARSLLQDLGMAELRGPDPNGVYAVRLPVGAPSVPAALARLRSDPRIVFAEPAAPTAAGKAP